MEKSILIFTICLIISIIANIAFLVAVTVISLQKKQQCKTRIEVDQRIVGGQLTSVRKHPYVAGIIYILKGDLIFQCGASIVSKHWVITAAHCVLYVKNTYVPQQDVKITAGSPKWEKGNRHDVESYYYHKDYDKDTNNNDIGMIKVSNPFEGILEKPIAIANKRFEYITNSSVTTIGWGILKENTGDIQKELYEVTIQLLDYTYCKNLYKNADEGYRLVSDVMVCAGDYVGTKDACTYDSGGPLVYRNILIGVVSWGTGCARKYQPGVYVRITKFESWIREKLGNDSGFKFVESI